jgi:hypothetical protein
MAAWQVGPFRFYHAGDYNQVMRHRALKPLLLISVLLMGALATHADTPMTKLLIQVKNEAGRAVDRAEVVVNFVQGRSVLKFGRNVHTSYDLRTNQEGEAKIPSIPQGKIKIMVNAKGYQTYGQTFDVAEDEKTIEIKLYPPQPQYSVH